MNAWLIFVTLLLVKASTPNLIKPRISSGQDASRSQFPFMAFIHMHYPPHIFRIHVCDGVVIDALWILSSGTCVKATLRLGKFRVKVGKNYSWKGERPSQIIRIAERFIHEDSDQLSRPRNTGLLKLQDAIADPVVVNLFQSDAILTGKIYMIGWGKTSSIDETTPDYLQFAEVDIMKKSDCQSLLSEMQSTFQVHDSQACTHIPEAGTSACPGDGGGPLIHYNNGEPYVYALLSWGLNPCGQVGAPTVSTRVFPVAAWIADTMRTSANPSEFPAFEDEDIMRSFLVNVP